MQIGELGKVFMNKLTFEMNFFSQSGEGILTKSNGLSHECLEAENKGILEEQGIDH